MSVETSSVCVSSNNEESVEKELSGNKTQLSEQNDIEEAVAVVSHNGKIERQHSGKGVAAENNTESDSVGVATPETFNVKTAEERLAERRKSLVPMSSMEEENLRERLHLAQLRQCSAIVYNEVRYTKDNFRRMFQTKVRSHCYYINLNIFLTNFSLNVIETFLKNRY